jgi:hypothetical protein
MFVDDFCTCGAKLPEAARFCHKCGRPLFEMPALEPEPEEQFVPSEASAPPLVAAPRALPSGISMRNPVAVRAAFITAVIAALLFMMPFPPEIHWLWEILLVVSGGFGAVWVYQRRTGSYLNVRSGAHLGWITGTFCFLILLVMFTVTIAAGTGAEGLQQIFRDMASQRGSPELAQQFETIISSPAGVAALIFFTLLTWFLMVTLLATAGGALGAKVLEKE